MAAQTGYRSTSGSIFAMLFGAVAIVGVIGVAANTLIRGPMSSMADVTRRTVAENSMIANSRLAIIMSGTQTTPDCDGDTMIEPLPYTNAGASPKPAGGGYLPTTMGASLTDPWGTQYGYCVWDHGSSIKVAGCGGAGALRLAGTNAKTYTSIAIISAGKDRVFQTSCAAYVNPATALVNRPAGSDDIIISHTYAEMEAIGGDGIWRRKDAATADIDKDVEIRSAANAVTARIEKETGYGLFNSIYVDNIHKRTAARITVQDETLFNGNVGLGMVPAAGMRLDVNGSIRTLNAAPTIFMQDTDHASAVLHTNSNTFHILSAPANSPTWAINGSYWPLTINLTNDVTTFGGPVNLNEGGLTVYTGGVTVNAGGASITGGATVDGGISLTSGNLALHAGAAITTPAGTIRDANGGWVRTYGTTGWYNGTYGGGMYMDSASYVRTYNGKPLMAPSFYDENNAGYYVDPNGTSNFYTTNAVYGTFNNTIGGNGVSSVSTSGYGVYGQSSNTYGVYGKTLSGANGGVLGYDANGSIYGILGHANAYSLYGNGQLYVTGTSYIPFIYDLNNTGYYWDGNGTSSNNVMYAYAYYYHSDARKKKNIVTIPATDVDKLYDLRGVHFDWKESGKHDIGLIAQEVQKVFPELVSQLKEDELGVQYGNLIPLLIEAAKAQKAELEEQKTQISKFKEQLATSIEIDKGQNDRIEKLEALLTFPKPGTTSVPPAQVSAAPAQTPAPVPPQSTGLVMQPKVDMAKIKGAGDIGICPQFAPPACVSKPSLSNAEEFTCRTEMYAYIYSAKIHRLCLNEHKDALNNFRAEYEEVVKKAVEKKFDLGDTSLDDIGYSQVIALEDILSGRNIAPPAPPPPLPLQLEQPLPPVASPASDIDVPLSGDTSSSKAQQAVTPAPVSVTPVLPPTAQGQNTAAEKAMATHAKIPSTAENITAPSEGFKEFSWLPLAAIIIGAGAALIFVVVGLGKNK